MGKSISTPRCDHFDFERPCARPQLEGWASSLPILLRSTEDWVGPYDCCALELPGHTHTIDMAVLPEADEFGVQKLM